MQSLPPRTQFSIRCDWTMSCIFQTAGSDAQGSDHLSPYQIHRHSKGSQRLEGPTSLPVLRTAAKRRMGMSLQWYLIILQRPLLHEPHLCRPYAINDQLRIIERSQ